MPTKEELFEKWENRDFSWSQISSFEYDKEQWYRCYFLGKKDRPSEEMLFGSKIGKLLEKDPTFLPMIPREEVMEYKFEAIFDDIKLVGYADSFGMNTLVLHEYKTGVKEWDRKRVKDHGQIDMYLFMLWLTFDIDPALVKCHLHWMPTMKKENGDFSITIDFVPDIEKNIKHFETARTKTQIAKFGQRINRVRKEMRKYAEEHE